MERYGAKSSLLTLLCVQNANPATCGMITSGMAAIAAAGWEIASPPCSCSLWCPCVSPISAKEKTKTTMTTGKREYTVAATITIVTIDTMTKEKTEIAFDFYKKNIGDTHKTVVTFDQLPGSSFTVEYTIYLSKGKAKVSIDEVAPKFSKETKELFKSIGIDPPEWVDNYSIYEKKIDLGDLQDRIAALRKELKITNEELDKYFNSFSCYNDFSRYWEHNAPQAARRIFTFEDGQTCASWLDDGKSVKIGNSAYRIDDIIMLASHLSGE